MNYQGGVPINNVPLWQQYALALHAYNMKAGFVCTGFLEDDPRTNEENKN
jgi:hypothetical protein